jgi:hypothetical protein
MVIQEGCNFKESQRGNRNYCQFNGRNGQHGFCYFAHDFFQLQIAHTKANGLGKRQVVPNLDKTIRGTVVQQMFHVAGPCCLGLIGYWNGNFFSHATLNYYKRNESLFGAFDMHKVNQGSRVMVTTNLSTLDLQTQDGGIEWYLPIQVQRQLRAYDLDVAVQPLEFVPNTLPQIGCDGLAVLVWFDDSCTSRAKLY